MTVFHDFEIVVTPNPDAPEALQKIGEQYWIISEINPDLKTVQWAQNVSDIDHQPGHLPPTSLLQQQWMLQSLPHIVVHVILS